MIWKKKFPYFQAAPFSPLTIQQCMWFHIFVHLVSRWLEVPYQLHIDFSFMRMIYREYVVLRHKTQQKSFQGSLSCDEAPTDGRIYAFLKCPSFPVKMLRLILSKTDKHATNFFNVCVKGVLISSSSCDAWHSAKSLQNQWFSGFVWDKCKSTKCQNNYTPTL